MLEQAATKGSRQTSGKEGVNGFYEPMENKETLI